MSPVVILPQAALVARRGGVRREVDALLSVQRFFAGILPEPWDVRTQLEAGEPPRRPYALIEFAGPGLSTGGPAAQDRTVPITANLYLEHTAALSREDAANAALIVREDVWQAVKWGPDEIRPTTDRIPLYSYLPRTEKHRFKVAGATGGTFTVTIAGETTIALAPSVTAEQLAAMIGVALGAAPDSLIGYDRGNGLWDVEYGGEFAGVNVSAPSIDGTLLTGSRPVATARTLLEGAAAPWRTASDYMRVDSFQQSTVLDPTDPSRVMVAVDLRLTFTRGLPLSSGQRILQRISATVGSGIGALDP